MSDLDSRSDPLSRALGRAEAAMTRAMTRSAETLAMPRPSPLPDIPLPSRAPASALHAAPSPAPPKPSASRPPPLTRAQTWIIGSALGAERIRVRAEFEARLAQMQQQLDEFRVRLEALEVKIGADGAAAPAAGPEESP